MEDTEVSRITAEGPDGSFGLLPRRLDCVALLVPGILTYEASGREVFVAVDEGVLIKSGGVVRVSVRRALGEAPLEALRAAVERDFMRIDQRERGMRAVFARMEGDLIRRMVRLQNER